MQNHCIVGVVGPFTSAVAAAEMPIAANAGLVMISPDTTYAGLTLRHYSEMDGWTFDQLHPPGKPLTFLELSPIRSRRALRMRISPFTICGIQRLPYCSVVGSTPRSSVRCWDSGYFDHPAALWTCDAAYATGDDQCHGCHFGGLIRLYALVVAV